MKWAKLRWVQGRFNVAFNGKGFAACTFQEATRLRCGVHGDVRDCTYKSKRNRVFQKVAVRPR